MKSFLLVAGVALSIAFSLNPGVALAQHEGMQGHDSMDGGHANMPAGDKPTPEKKKKKKGGETKPADVNYNKGSSNSQTTNPNPP